MCGDSHSYDQCPYNSESVQFVGNFNRQQNNPYSNTYNPGWRNHPNFSWSNNAGPSNPKPIMPPGFQQQARPQIPEKKSQLEELLLQYISKTDAIIQSQGASLRNLETQVGQLANSINNRPQGSLPSDTQINPKGKEQCQAITLRSGKEIEGVNQKAVESEIEHVDKEECVRRRIESTKDVTRLKIKEPLNLHPPPPFPKSFKSKNLKAISEVPQCLQEITHKYSFC
ncbi:uncharacterized protein LOC110416390 [Herrania umbratica]|uniref:Uncharacterized protein LOC110416390 n=1 Tax=Herrania umbratica TaxID=108875 RepID=A0A6J1AB81_9ROSI|nr:uncharacterized protein LOC110416390 [Herrania umbratica]